jgi:hypothetical protein
MGALPGAVMGSLFDGLGAVPGAVIGGIAGCIENVAFNNPWEG